MMNRSIMVLERDGEEVRLHYSHDNDLSFQMSVIRAGKLQVAYYSLVSDYVGLSGLLDVLVDFGIFSREQVQEALCAVLLAGSADDIDDPGIRRVADLVRAIILQ